MNKFDVKQGDLTVEARYATPAFALMRPEGQAMLEILLAKLAQYGANPDTVFVDTTGSFGARNATINMPALNGAVKVFVAKLELGFNDLSKLQFSDIAAVTAAIAEAIQKAAPGTQFITYGVTLNYHGLIEGTTHADFVRQYTAAVPDLGPVTSTAIGFYYGAKGHRSFLNLVIDASAIFQGATFIRVAAGFDGKQIQLPDLPKAGGAMLEETLGALGLAHSLDTGQ